ncbi:condensation domain-containing protein [Streptomyces sp. NPDC056480]|uniref:condensation domain-containing protein n=1 Tax=Streptomyces sp. NPDC056480 TaxID=3345833 RepID=UPI0036A46909
MTAAQQGVWVAQQLAPTCPLYNAAEYIQVDGPLDTTSFAQALRKTVAEADALHVRFEADSGGVIQLLNPPGEWELPIIDVSGEPDPDRAALAWMRTDLQAVVDLQRGPLFAHALFRLGPDRYQWYHRTHHIALDGYSFSLIANRVAQLYTAVVTGRPNGAGRLTSLQAALDDEALYRRSSQYEADQEFWQARFANPQQAVSLSERVSVPSGRLIRSSRQLPSQSMDGWRALAGQNGATWAEAVLALTALYVHRRTGADEVVLGLPVMGRLGSATARAPVMLMNTVPLRVPINPQTGPDVVVQAVVAQMREIRPHQRYRGEQLRRDLRLVGGNRRLFGPMINVMPFDYGLHFAGHPARATNLSAGAGFVEDLAIHLHVRADGAPLTLDIDANPNCYAPAELTKHLDQLTDLLTSFTTVRPLSR